MTADQRHLDVPELLRDWADAQHPEPSAALHDFLRGAAPLAAASAARSGGPRARSAARGRAATRAGLTMKVAVVLTGLTITSAAAAGIAHVTSEAGGPAPAGPSATAPAVPDADLEPETSGAPASVTTGPVTPAPSSARPRHGTRSAEPSKEPSEDASDDSQPSASTDATDAPEPSATDEATGSGSTVETAGVSTPAADPTDAETP